MVTTSRIDIGVSLVTSRCEGMSRSSLSGSGQQIGEGDGDATEGKRRDAGASAENLDVEIPPAELRRAIEHGLAVDFECPVREVHDPVIRDACASVETALVAAVEVEACLG